jgi:hypothetical protein
MSLANGPTLVTVVATLHMTYDIDLNGLLEQLEAFLSESNAAAELRKCPGSHDPSMAPSDRRCCALR